MRIVQSYARIESMEQYYATVGSEGELEIPVAICESLGIVDGTRVAICVEGDRIILQPETRLAEQRTIKEMCIRDRAIDRPGSRGRIA